MMRENEHKNIATTTGYRFFYITEIAMLFVPISLNLLALLSHYK